MAFRSKSDELVFWSVSNRLNIPVRESRLKKNPQQKSHPAPNWFHCNVEMLPVWLVHVLLPPHSGGARKGRRMLTHENKNSSWGCVSSPQSIRATSKEYSCPSGLFYIFTPRPGEGANRLTLFGILIMCICSSFVGATGERFGEGARSGRDKQARNERGS